MARSLTHSETSPSHHPSAAATAASAGIPILAIVAIVAAFCASHQRRSSSSPTPFPSYKSTKLNNSKETQFSKKPPTPTLPPEEEETEPDDVLVVVDVSHGPITPTEATTEGPATWSRRLSMSLSMKMIPEGLARIRTAGRREQRTNVMASKEAGHKDDDDESTLWRKAIILGEKCKVPVGDEDDEISVYDGSGRRTRNYHPRTPRSLPVSRTNSFVNTTDVFNPS